jgi:hypothetical protein
LAAAIANTSPTAPSRIQSAFDTEPTTLSRSAVTTGRNPVSRMKVGE